MDDFWINGFLHGFTSAINLVIVICVVGYSLKEMY